MADGVLQRKCRACLANNNAAELFDWREEISTYDPTTYAQFFHQCTRLEAADELPQLLCEQCKSELRIAYAFVKKAFDSDRTLRKALADVRHPEQGLVKYEILEYVESDEDVDVKPIVACSSKLSAASPEKPCDSPLDRLSMCTESPTEEPAVLDDAFSEAERESQASENSSEQHIRPEWMNPAHKKCVVPNCVGGQDRKFYRFPQSGADLWCENLKISPHIVKSNTRICNRHFDTSCFGKRKLKVGSIPTECLGHDEEAPNFPMFSAYSSNTNRNVRKCCVEGCTSTSPPGTLYAFPTDREKHDLWTSICNVSEKAKSLKVLRICSMHFAPEDAGGRKKKNAVPKYFLGY